MRVPSIFLQPVMLASCTLALMLPAAAQAQDHSPATHSYAMALPPAAVDRDFVMRLREQDLTAIDAAKTAMAHGQDQQLKKMAARLIEARTSDLHVLDAWLAGHADSKGQ